MSKSKSARALTMNKNTHSSYWLDRDLFVDDVDVLDSKDTLGIVAEGPNLMKMVRLAAIRRAVSNFVQILVGKQIPVQYSSGKDSYTDGEHIVISADENPDTFDPTVGLALHEASHVLLSDFTFLKALVKFQTNEVPYTVPNGTAYQTQQRWDVFTADRKTFVTRDSNILSKLLLPELFAQLPCPSDYNYVLRTNKMLNDIKVLMNILEDRRIDKYVYTNAAGYRPYYDALYSKYFYTEDQANNLRYNPEWRELTVDNYVNRLLLAFHPAADPEALVGLKELIALMDIKSIERVGHIPTMTRADGTTMPMYYNSVQYEEMPQLWKDACVLYAHILTFVKDGQDTSKTQQEAAAGGEGEGGEGGEGEGEGEGESSEAELPNMDAPMGKMAPTPVEVGPKGKAGKFSASKANKELEAMKKIMNNEAKKKKITAAEATAITSMEQASAEIVDIKGDGVPFGHCMITRKLSESIISSDWFIFGRPAGWANNQTAIAAGRRMGAILEQRLQVRNDPIFTKQTRLPQGGLDRRLLAQLGMDITSVFQKSRVDMHRPAMLHLTIDASGSMGGNKWAQCVTVAVALAHVGSKIRNIDTVVSIRGGVDMPMVAILFDSRRDQLATFIKHMNSIMPSGATPEGLCFKATMDLVLESADTHDVYFINFSDGEPSFDYTRRKALDKSGVNQYFSYGGDLAITHTRKMVKMIKDRGVKVLSYFISEDGNYYADITFAKFRKMYGEDAVKVNISNATEVVRTVNKLLLARGA